jgi:dTDP-4-dehydrorhamnose reductase
MIWLIGNKGMLGTELSRLLETKRIPFVGTDQEIDITDSVALYDFASNQLFNWIINCAAYTAVDKAEDDEALCCSLNTDGAANIATAAKAIGAKLIHISTDYVFNGQGIKPLTEEDITAPIGVYGLSKRDGELKVSKENEKSYIIRTAWLYGKYGNNFVKTMLKAMNEREIVSVVNDQTGSPTWAHDLANVIIEIIRLKDQEKKNIPYGIYHYTNEGEITWYDFAKEIYNKSSSLNIIEKACEIKPCTSADFPAKVKRPVYSVLDKSKIKKILGLEIPNWKDSLMRFLNA